MSDTTSRRLADALADRYAIERELGQGGMATVYLAHDLKHRRRVAVKVLRPELSAALGAERFLREIETTANLRHPHILPLYDSGEAGGFLFYVMPLVEGESLRDTLRREKRLPVEAALRIAREVADALSYAHERGVIHRDIKPENILLESGHAVVADFGIARVVSAVNNARLTQTGVSIGTPMYMSPEQATGEASLDGRSDLYSLACVIYEMLGGQPPFVGPTSASIVRQHLTLEPPPVTSLRPDVPAHVSSALQRALAKSPEDRPATAREMADGIVARSGRARDLANAILPRRLPIAAAVIATVALGGIGLVWMKRGTAARPESSASAAESAASAQDSYLRGRVRVNSENRLENDAAIDALRKAIRADPSFAPAYATLSRAYTLKAFYFAPDSEKPRLNEDAEVALAKALSLDPQLGEAYAARGLMLWTPARRFPHEQAVQAYRQAITRDSSLDEAHHQLAVVYFHVGLLDRAEQEIATALAINPGNTLARFRLGVIDMYRGRYDRAYATFKSTPLQSNPSLWSFQIATVLFRLGREREAAEVIDQFLLGNPKDEGGAVHSVRAMMLAKAGRKAEAEAEIATSLELGSTFGHFHHTAYNIASAYAILGNRDQAVRWLRHAADNGFPCYPLFAEDTHLNGLRRDPQFVALLAQLKRDWEERKRKF